MATYYYDKNGITAGFLTLSGNWSDAAWSTSSAGTATTSAVTFASGDIARFGATGTSGTAGNVVVDIATVHLSQIITQNLAGLQILSGSNVINFLGTASIDVSSVGGLSISARVNGSSVTINKIGTGTLTLSGLNNYNSLSLTTGTLSAASATALGDAANGTFTLGSGTTLSIGGFTLTKPTILFQGGSINSITSSNALSFTTGTLTGTNTITTTTDLTINSILDGTGGITKAGAGTLNLGAANTFSGNVTINSSGGTIACTNANSLGANSGTLTVGTSGKIQISGNITIEKPTAALTGCTLESISGTNSFIFPTGTLSGTVTTTVTAGTLTLDSPLSGAGGLTKSGSGKLILLNSNTFSGNLAISAGTLSCSDSSAFGSNLGTFSMSSGAVLDIDGNITLAKPTFTLATPTINCNATTYASLTCSTGTITGVNTINVTQSAGELDIIGTLSSTGSITKTGVGILTISGTNSHSGAVTVSAGVLNVKKLAANGTASSIGTASTLTLGSNTTLSHQGTSSDSTNKTLSCNATAGTSLTLDSSGVGGSISYTGGSLTFSVSGSHTLVFSGINTITNTFGNTIADASGGGATSIQKDGSNTWNITGSITATGGISCFNGILSFGSTNRVLSNTVTVSTGTLAIANGNTFSAPITMSNITGNGGSITAVLTGSNTLTVSSTVNESNPAFIRPDSATGNNTLSGSVNVDGALKIATTGAINPSTVGNGKILGSSSTVTVAATGILTTCANELTSQAGKARYNNLTFASGANFKIGYPAITDRYGL